MRSLRVEVVLSAASNCGERARERALGVQAFEVCRALADDVIPVDGPGGAAALEAVLERPHPAIDHAGAHTRAAEVQ